MTEVALIQLVRKTYKFARGGPAADTKDVKALVQLEHELESKGRGKKK